MIHSVASYDMQAHSRRILKLAPHDRAVNNINNNIDILLLLLLLNNINNNNNNNNNAAHLYSASITYGLRKAAYTTVYRPEK